MTLASKRWCDGYRDKRTSKIYYHASTQTQDKTPIPIDLKYRMNSKILQTPSFLMYPPVEKEMGTDRTVGTQMWRHNLYIPSLEDRIIEPKDYVPYQYVYKEPERYGIEEPEPVLPVIDEPDETTVELLEEQLAKDVETWHKKYLTICPTREERIQLLLDMKCYMESFGDGWNVLQIIELLEEEKVMLEINADYLDGLRKRTSFMLQDLIEKIRSSCKKVIPEVTFQCPSCREYKTSHEFKWTTTVNQNYCTSCSRLVKTGVCAEWTVGLSPYMEILGEVRQEEDCPDNHVALLITPPEVRLLVDRVWRGSVVSGETDPYKLSLPKWDRERPWSPWNCVLLTRYETRTHKTQMNLNLFYSRQFIQKVESKQKQAQERFKLLSELERY